MADREITQTAHVSDSAVSIMAGGDVIISYASSQAERFTDDPVGECPYPGLAAFGPDQASWFFGREPVLAALRVRLDRSRSEGGGPVAVIGSSGVGKSSLLRCGLIHAVTTNGYGEAGSRDWPHLVCTPTEAPLTALATALEPLIGQAGPDEQVSRLRAELDARRLLLVVDQLEELFTADTAERTAFLDALDRLCSGADAPAMVVLGLRADYYGRCLVHPWLAAALRDEPIQVGPLDRAALERVVLGPAERVGLTVQPALVQALLADTGTAAVPGEDGAGRLPLLAHSLRATWLKRRGTTLTLEGYQDTGGIQGAVATTADRAFDRLSQDGQRVARAVFLRLVWIGVDTDDTRRRVMMDELVADLPASEEVVAAYTTQRLLTVDRDGVTITHEALLYAWGRLRAWIESDRAGNLLRQELHAQALAWQAGTHGLYQGVALHNARSWATEHPRDVSPPIARFLAASGRADRRRRRAWQAVGAALLTLTLVASGLAVYASNQRDQAATQRTTAVARLVANEAQNLLSSQPGLAKQLALVAANLDSTSSGEGAVLAAAQSPGLYDGQDAIVDVAETRDDRTLALSTGRSVALWNTRGHADARITGLGAVGPVALSPNGQLLAAAVGGGPNATVRLWSIADPTHPTSLATLPAGAAGAESVALNATVLAVGTDTGTIRLWSTANPTAPQPLPSLSGHPGGADSLAFQPASPVLASSGADHQIRLWDTTNGALLSTVDGYHGVADADTPNYTPVYHRVAFSPDGSMLAAPGDSLNSELRLWGVRDPANPTMLAAPTTNSLATSLNVFEDCGHTMHSVSFAPDGAFLATVCGSSLLLWQTGKMSDVRAVSGMPIADSNDGPAIFSAKQYTVLNATQNGLQDWDVSNPDQPGALDSIDQGTNGLVTAAAFSSGQRKLFATDGGLWDLSHGVRTLATLPGAGIGDPAVAFSPDGNLLADSEQANKGRDLVLRLRDTTRPGAPVLATEDSEIQDGVTSLSFSPDGRTLAVADNLGNPDAPPPTVKLFDVGDPAQPRLIAVLPVGAMQVAFAPKGHILVADTADSLLSWNVSDPAHPVALRSMPLTPGSKTSASAFSPDGRLIAVGDDSGTIRLWPVADDQVTGNPIVFHAPGFAGAGDAMTFSPDGDTLALADNGPNPNDAHSTYVQFWDVTDPSVAAVRYQFRVGSGEDIGPLAFSGDGKILATGFNGVVLWQTTPDADTVCRSVGDIITPIQWAKYVPDEPYNPPCRS